MVVMCNFQLVTCRVSGQVRSKGEAGELAVLAAVGLRLSRGGRGERAWMRMSTHMHKHTHAHANAAFAGAGHAELAASYHHCRRRSCVPLCVAELLLRCHLMHQNAYSRLCRGSFSAVPKPIFAFNFSLPDF